ncbi:hypothetical protein C4577_03795 [Candidatus Parcubacteria bacterium]|nr:MAG: hypothetical protein C4577_03795 [Candidatus Parcubacteria bacterium]
MVELGKEGKISQAQTGKLMETSRYTKAKGVQEEVRLMNGSYCDLPLRDSSVSGVFTILNKKSWNCLNLF